MPTDQPIAAGGPALSPEEVGARVSAILAAAERDARAVIDAAHRDAAAAAAPAEPTPTTIAALAHAIDDLRGRVEALERGVAGAHAPRGEEPGRTPERDERVGAAEPREKRGCELAASARVLAIDLALAGHSREAIAQELGTTMGSAEVDRLLDEVLTR